MFKFKRSFSLFFLVLTFLWTVHANAEDNSCRLMAPEQDDVWVIVYDADDDGNRKQIIWKGKIEAGKQITVNATDGNIRYDYTLDPGSPYGGDLSRGCHDQKIILVE